MKLKVGDIEMDSTGGISFGGSPASPEASPGAEGSQQALAVAEERSLAGSDVGDPGAREVVRERGWLDRMPDWSSGVYMMLTLFSLAAVGGLGAAVVFLPIAPPWTVLPLVPAPGLLFAGWAFFWKGYKQAYGDVEEVGAIDLERAKRLRAVIEDEQRALTVEELISRLGWREAAVVSGLKAGVDSALIVEDLNVETGHWCYEAAPDPEEERRRSRQALPLDERMALLEED